MNEEPLGDSAVSSSSSSSATSKQQLPPAIERVYVIASRRLQKTLDDLTPHLHVRWIGTAAVMSLYFLRIYYIQGFHIITYALGIYMLNLFIAFLTPQIDPALANLDGAEDDGPTLPTSKDEEFRPFIRRLPEFKFWYAVTRAILLAILCTFFGFMDIPVFWPILVLYFIILFGVTMKRQIRHMIKYRYLPFSHGKRTYKGKDEPAKH
ncbi:RER1 protein [Capsaspora owczarzaki ATCC 30864]|nr:RER1 protein [Capsaspora owczarzaki ATCC 30864]|eukprot:XP_004365441.1 RER1 protein [Capsaspora owczarzaki ATCC 30864]